MIEDIFYGFLEYIDNEKSMQLHRKTLENEADKGFKNRMESIAQSYRDADAVRIGLLAPEGSPARLIAEAFIEEARPHIEAEQQLRAEAAKKNKPMY